MGLFNSIKKSAFCAKDIKWIALWISMIAIPFAARAENLDNLYQKLVSLDSQKQTLQRDYQREKSANEERMKRSSIAREQGDTKAAEQHLQEAYGAAARLEHLNQQLTELERQRTELCNLWITEYGSTIDRLLHEAEQESNKKKRAETGVLMQKYQNANNGLCERGSANIPVEWQNLQIESYDGPAEIRQKVQILQEISREVSIGMARLETQYQQALRERRTRDRAQEFVQEGTLFDQNVTVRSRSAGTTTTGEGNVPLSGVDRNVPLTPNPTDITMQPGGDALWQGAETAEQIEADYKKRRTGLEEQQQQLLKKIKEFEKIAKKLMEP